MKECDIVITNPPFSLFREFLTHLMCLSKKFIIVGPLLALSYKEIFTLVQENKLWLGVSPVINFEVPEQTFTSKSFELNGKYYQRFDNVYWWTNIEHNHYHVKINLEKQYIPTDYNKYINYDAINVDKVVDIPYDYNGVVGVPITFLTKYNPEQFDIVGFRKGNDGKDLSYIVNGKIKTPYFRILIQKK